MQALTHLPAADSNPAQNHRRNAWLAAQHGDARSERFELEQLLAVAPADVTALDRLARLAEKEGHDSEVARLRTRIAAAHRVQARYQKLFERKQPVRDAEEMSDLAAQLGRSFEARALLTLAITEEPDRNDLRRASRCSTKLPGRPDTAARNRTAPWFRRARGLALIDCPDEAGYCCLS